MFLKEKPNQKQIFLLLLGKNNVPALTIIKIELLLKNMKNLVIVLALVAVVASGSAYYFYAQNQQAQKLIKNPSQLGKNEVSTLVANVKKLMALPDKEDPTVATVTDAAKLNKQPFFKNAKNGDKLLIYTASKKAILYRPSQNIIIETAPVNVGKPQGTQGQTAGVATKVSPTAEPSPTEKVSPTGGP